LLGDVGRSLLYHAGSVGESWILSPRNMILNGGLSPKDACTHNCSYLFRKKRLDVFNFIYTISNMTFGSLLAVFHFMLTK
jgi:hypothetical protein